MRGNVHNMVRLAKHAWQLTNGLTATMYEALTVRIRRTGCRLPAAASVRWCGSRCFKFED
eukprot:7535006-Alexandrium_andersonii.AAC.1